MGRLYEGNPPLRSPLVPRIYPRIYPRQAGRLVAWGGGFAAATTGLTIA